MSAPRTADVPSKLPAEQPASAVSAPSVYSGPESVPSELIALLTRCLHKEPAHRLGSVRELARRLREIAPAEPWTEQRANAWWREHVPAVALRSTFTVDTGRAPTLMSIDG